MPYGTRAPKETATPSAGPGTAPAFCFRVPDRNAVGAAGIAVARPETTSLSMSCGTRAQDVRPGDPDGAWILRSFPLAELIHLAGTAYCWCCVLLMLRTAGGLSQRHFSTASPVARPAPAPAWNPAVEPPGTRARSRRLYRGTAEQHCWSCELHLPNCSWRPLITAGHPVRSSVPSPSCTNPGFGTPPPHRPANCAYWYFRPGSSCLPRLARSRLREKP